MRCHSLRMHFNAACVGHREFRLQSGGAVLGFHGDNRGYNPAPLRPACGRAASCGGVIYKQPSLPEKPTETETLRACRVALDCVTRISTYGTIFLD